jgi:2-amino-4-hydroxy-6-hydroxymethyldihydropteridine diphosphokinase
MSKAFVALGSNLQDPVLQVKNSFVALEKLPKTKLIKASSLYITAPLGYNDQPDFINAVAELNTQLSPEILLEALHGIENEAGRERPFPNAPRVLDCDLLLYDNVTTQTEKLTLPHPRMHERAFVLLPLAEIAPDLSLPDGSNVVKLAQQFINQGIHKLQEE